MKKENKNQMRKITYILYLVSSICFFIGAILGFISGNNMAVMNLCLGACSLCLSSMYYKKYTEENEKENEEEKENKK